MSDVINLRMARKRKARSERERTAGENRLLHGMPKAERKRSRAEADKITRLVEAHRRERDDHDP